MLKLCKCSTVVLHFLLLSHIAHTFVLLTANVEDVKKIARKFVSEELAEKIAEFIARATESLSQQPLKSSEEEIKDNSQVSAENRMYNVGRHGFEGSSKHKDKSKGDNAVKDKVKASTDKKEQSEYEDIETTPNLRKETKGKSRYIIESDQQVTTTTERASSKSSEEENYNKMKDSIKTIENNLLGVKDKARTKKPKLKKGKAKPYKLLSAYDSGETDDVKDRDDDKEREDQKKRSQRSFDEEIAAIRHAATEYDDDGKKKMAETPIPIKDEPDNYDIEVKKKTDEVAMGSSLVIGKNDKEDKWWEKDLPKHNQDQNVNLKRKTWF